MGRTWVAVSGIAIALAAFTVPWRGDLGAPVWHHHVSLLLSIPVVAAGAWLGRQDLRRHASLAVATWTMFALISGFLILYLKQDLKATDLKDWAKFWHVAWSWLALWAFVLHTWINRYGLVRALRRMHAGWLRAAAFTGALVLVAVAIPLSWSATGARVLQEPQFIPLTLWTAFVVVSIPYVVWIARRAHVLRWRGLRRGPVQHFVDAWLLPMTLLANLSGFPILYFDTKSTSLKYVAKYWHVWPSMVMAVLIFAHTVQFWPAMRRHWRA